MSESRRPGPKVYELARELGMSPRALITIARSLEIPAQNRLTRISPQSAAKLAAHCAALPTSHDQKNEKSLQFPDDST